MEKIDQELNKLLNNESTIKIINKLKNKNNICPHFDDIFRAFKLCPLSKTKVVIFGQDPYHQRGVADGLAFSTRSKKTPASLKNIFKEIENEYKNFEFKSNNLEIWAKQGILLLNSQLSVEEGKPLSHKNLHWDTFIKSVIELLNNYSNKIIFVLWGNNAKKYLKVINIKKHFVLISAHPSPLSANRGFFGNNHFITINKILKSLNKKEINWNID